MIIGLTGKAGAGKTTVADHLVEKYGFVKINFKDALVAEMKKNFPDTLREMAHFYHITSTTWASKFPLDTKTEVLVDFLFKDKPPIMRALMQNYGTEVRRADNKNYWVDQWINKVHAAIEKGQGVVVDDCRFLNEADALKLNDGKIIRVERIGYLDLLKHVSETEQEQIEPDFIAKSKTGGHSFLYEQIDKFINEQSNQN